MRHIIFGSRGKIFSNEVYIQDLLECPLRVTFRTVESSSILCHAQEVPRFLMMWCELRLQCVPGGCFSCFLSQRSEKFGDNIFVCLKTTEMSRKDDVFRHNILEYYVGINLTGYHLPRANPRATIFSVKIPAPGTAFHCKTSAPGSKNEAKSPPLGII